MSGGGRLLSCKRMEKPRRGKMAMTDPDQKESHFHAMRSLAHHFANRGYRTTQSFEEFYDYLLKECTVDRFTQVLAAGIIADLHEIACTQRRCLNEIERQSSSVIRLLEHWSESVLKPPVDPIADACLLCWKGSYREIPSVGAGWYDHLETRLYRTIHFSGCSSAGELAAFGKRRLRGIRNCGALTVWKIEEFLRETYGLELAD
jgi:hypothetical protein